MRGQERTVSQSVSVRYKETPRGPANPMLTPGPNPCPPVLSVGSTKSSDLEIVFGMLHVMCMSNWRAINWVLPRRFESCSPRFYPMGAADVSR
jgi:hypothetical protein